MTNLNNLAFEHLPPEVTDLFVRLADELQRQNVKWGEQNHPMISGSNAYRKSFAVLAAELKRQNELHALTGSISWDAILREEVYEALEEDDPARAVYELIQVAAVALQAALSIQRNGLNGTRK